MEGVRKYGGGLAWGWKAALITAFGFSARAPPERFAREECLAARGYRVLRIRNMEVAKRIEEVTEVLRAALAR